MRSEIQIVEALNNYADYGIENNTLDYIPENFILASVLCLTPTKEYFMKTTDDKSIRLEDDFRFPPEQMQYYKTDRSKIEKVKSKTHVKNILSTYQANLAGFPSMKKFGYDKNDIEYREEKLKIIKILEWVLFYNEYYIINNIIYK